MCDVRSIPKTWVHPIVSIFGKETWVKLKPYEEYSKDFKVWCDNLEKFFIVNKWSDYQDFLDVHGVKPERVNYMPYFKPTFTLVDIHYSNNAPSIPVDIYLMLKQSTLENSISLI